MNDVVTLTSRAANINGQLIALRPKETILVTGVVTRISVSSGGVEGDSDAGDAVFSPDGNTVLFTSDATTLVAGDTNDYQDIFAVTGIW